MSQRVKRSERRRRQAWRASMVETWKERKCCVKCGCLATFEVPDSLCDAHWVDWWVEGFEEDGFTVQQRRKIRRETARMLKTMDSQRFHETFLNSKRVTQ